MGDLPPKSGCLTGKSDNHQWFTLSVRIMTRVGLLAVGFCLRELLRLLIQTVVAILFPRVHHPLPLSVYLDCFGGWEKFQVSNYRDGIASRVDIETSHYSLEFLFDG